MALGVALLLVGGFAAPARADDETTFGELRSHRVWTSWADARPISPYLGGRFLEFTTGVPFSRVELDGNPGRAAGEASYYYGSDEGETLLELFLHVYKNPTMAVSRYPAFGGDNREEVAPGGPVGPRAAAHAPNRTEASSEVRLGPGTGPASVAGGSASSSTSYNRDDLLVVETASGTQDVNLPGDVRVGVVQSAVRVDNHLGREPLITYRFALAGVDVDGKRLVDAGDGGIVLAGTKVAGRDLFDQFNKQVARYAAVLHQLAGEASLDLIAPRVEREDNGGYAVTGAVLEARRANTPAFGAEPLKGKPGEFVGVRLGYSRAYSQLLSFDH